MERCIKQDNSVISVITVKQIPEILHLYNIYSFDTA